MIPKRVLVITTIACVPEFLQRRLVTLMFQEIDYPATDQSVDETKNYGGFLFTVADNVQMIRHDYISQDQKPSGNTGLIERTTNNRLHCIKTKYGQSILGH